VAACTSPSENEDESGPTDFFFRDNPHSLEAAAYAQLATLIVNRVPFARCEGCGVLFNPKHGNQTHCTPTCNDRARKARQRAKEA
jgi:hypothetical protein